MILFAVEIFSTVFQRIFCESTLTKRQNKKALEIFVWVVYFVIFNVTTYMISSIPWINMIVFLVIFYIVIRFLYSNPVRTLVVVTVFMYLSGMCSELLVFFGKELLPLSLDSDAEIVLVVISKIVWFCIIKLVSLLIKLNKKIELNIQDWLEVFTVPIGSIWILLALYIQESAQGSFTRFMAVAMVLVINIFTYYLYDKAKETMERRMREEILVQQCESYIRQYKESQEWWEELRQFSHDMKQHYLLERTYLEAGDYEELKQYCDENLDFFIRKNIVSRTENIYVDSIINYKADVAEKQGIELIADLNIPKDMEVNVEDLSICLGNLLDNAIEASAEVDEDKTIYIQMDVDGNNLFLTIKNRFEEERCKSDGKYLTKKVEQKHHGLGLMIVQQIVNKYEGELRIHEEDNEFEVIVLLYNFLK